MPTERSGRAAPRRIALVLARHSSAAGTPPGIDPAAFARACLADSYEVLDDLVGVTAGVASPPAGPGEAPGRRTDTDDAAARAADLLWPTSVHLQGDDRVRALADRLRDDWDELVVVPADVPDLPGLVLAKVFQFLQRADVCVAPERGGSGCVALGLRLPWPAWLDVGAAGDLDLGQGGLGQGGLDLDRDPTVELRALAPAADLVAVAPDWHRLRTPSAVHRLDPGLEGWEQTRRLLSGVPTGGGGP